MALRESRRREKDVADATGSCILERAEVGVELIGDIRLYLVLVALRLPESCMLICLGTYLVKGSLARHDDVFCRICCGADSGDCRPRKQHAGKSRLI